MKWVKIVEKDNWGSLTTTVGGKPLVPGQYWVKWPDESESMVEIVKKPYHTTVYDMGHDSNVTTERFYLETYKRGLKLLVPVADLGKVRVGL
jgi:hypothetical protein